MNPAWTQDAFFQGRIQIRQYRSGYRFSIDSVILAHLTDPRGAKRILDLGAGCGVIGLLLTFRHSGIHVFCVEIQSELAELAELNAVENHLNGRMTVFRQDMKTLTQEKTAGPVDMAVCNPPYYRSATGRVNPDSQRAIARHEISAGLEDVLDAARRMLITSGRLSLIYPAERLTDLLSLMRLKGIEPKLMRMIHSRKNDEAGMAWVEGVQNARPGIRVLAPLTIYREDGSYADEAARMFSP
jgi:tRNA1Val (adenine37-N6)-methyltransferase